jgi:hypothetical protein
LGSDPDPIFVVGLPRSESTLIEQIIASHSQVEGTHELSELQPIVLEMRGKQLGLEIRSRVESKRILIRAC